MLAAVKGWQPCVGLSPLPALGLVSREEKTQRYSKSGAAKGLPKETKGCLAITFFAGFYHAFVEGC